MSSGPSGVGGAQPLEPPKPQPLGPSGGGDMQIKTLGDLKNLLTSEGPNGIKIYNQFVTSTVVMMKNITDQAASQAQQAAKQMRQQT